MSREIEYIIVQAGGKGSRLGYLTKNKPKALVPVDNRPMLFHLFEQFPQKKFIIITDYKSDVMRRYLSAFAEVKYLIAEVHGKTGTCAGLSDALRFIPAGQPFAFIWSDLVLPEDFSFPAGSGNYIGISKNFRCRWKYENGCFEESPSEEFGVAGFFIFDQKQCLAHAPDEGEFVKWLKTQPLDFQPIALYNTKEYGLLNVWQRDDRSDVSCRCRPFNKIRIENDVLIKTGIGEQGRALAVREKNWYRYAEQKAYARIPEIYSYDPLTMRKINGKNVFLYELTSKQKETVLHSIVDALRELHTFESADTDYFSIYDAYPKKTFARLEKIRDLVPFADRPSITVNGEACPNIFFHRDELERAFDNYCCEKFTFIHGDPTFSNILLDDTLLPVLIDPRGYFGFTELFGDPAYDWAKLYYSVRGNYDQFNMKHFQLEIKDTEVDLQIKSNHWEDLAPYLCRLICDETDEDTLKLLHTIIWFSLTTYAWEDYDSVCGAFYNGCRYLKEIL